MEILLKNLSAGVVFISGLGLRVEGGEEVPVSDIEHPEVAGLLAAGVLGFVDSPEGAEIVEEVVETAPVKVSAPTPTTRRRRGGK